MTLRVLQVFHGLGMGGAETWLLALIREFRRRGDVEVEVAVTGGVRRVLDMEIASLGVPIHYLDYRRGRRLSFMRAWRRLLCEGDFDAVHDHQDIQSGAHFLMGLGRLPRVRLAHFHNPYYQVREQYGQSARRRWATPALLRLTRLLSTNLTGTSRHLMGEYGLDRELGQPALHGPVHCGFDTGKFREAGGPNGEARHSLRAEFGWLESADVILFAGRLDSSAELKHPKNHKNSALALEIVLRLLEEDERAVALFAGQHEVPSLPLLKKRVDEAGFSHRVVFAGVRKDMPRLMSGADALLFPSRAEGLGMVAVEAQAAGLPVVTSTAVPAECCVAEDAVQFVGLDEPLEEWVQVLRRALGKTLDEDRLNEAVRASAFGIENSAETLANLYRTGRRVV